jgi:hypothetical protein
MLEKRPWQIAFLIGSVGIWFLFMPYPLPPLQPVVPAKPEDFLAGEGSLIERGLFPLSELTSPSQTDKKSSMGNNPV